MNLKLIRDWRGAEGIFGQIYAAGSPIKLFSTLEHAYPYDSSNMSFTAKVAPGSYVCNRHAPNRLPYETFEIMNVPDFQGNPVSGILFHVGNFNRDSEGCILLGMRSSNNAVIDSKVAFDQFMELQKGCDSFLIEIG